MKLLHCLPRAEYLEQALTSGLMFTDHMVRFEPTSDRTQFGDMLQLAMPIVNQQLASLNKSLGNISSVEEKILFSGIGTIEGKVPMLCFTEVPDGRSIAAHAVTFGQYGLVISRKWIEDFGGDRVAYVGHGSAFSKHLFQILVVARLNGLHVSSTGQILFDNRSLRPALDLLSYIEIRDHLHEAEWRIAGAHGFMGGKRSSGQRLELPLTEIDAVLVPRGEVSRFRSIVNSMARARSAVAPRVVEFSDSLPP